MTPGQKAYEAFVKAEPQALGNPGPVWGNLAAWEAAATAVVAEEREACAKLVAPKTRCMEVIIFDMLVTLAAAIRARSNS